jgi:hypothetical protein
LKLNHVLADHSTIVSGKHKTVNVGSDDSAMADLAFLPSAFRLAIYDLLTDINTSFSRD